MLKSKDIKINLDNLPKIKDGGNINIDQYNIGTHWVNIFVKSNAAISFYRFGVECILKGMLKSFGNKGISNIFRIQEYDPILLYWIY